MQASECEGITALLNAAAAARIALFTSSSDLPGFIVVRKLDNGI
jgi:hypothetical protein